MNRSGMFKKNRINNRAQSILDFILIFSVLVTFMIGLTRIWMWFNINYAKRNVDYQNGRLAAGKASVGREDTLAYKDKLLEINDAWVFRGTPSGEVGLPPVATETPPLFDDPTGLLCPDAQKRAADLRELAHISNCQAENLRIDCDDSDRCRDERSKAKQRLRAQAAEYKQQADELEMEACKVVTPYAEPDCSNDPLALPCPEAREKAADLRGQAHSLNCEAQNYNANCSVNDDQCIANEQKTKNFLRGQAISKQQQADRIEMAGCDFLEPYTEPTTCP